MSPRLTLMVGAAAIVLAAARALYWKGRMSTAIETTITLNCQPLRGGDYLVCGWPRGRTVMFVLTPERK
jgi:hypothetical protein